MPIHGDETYTIRDEWSPLTGVILSTQTINGNEALSPLASAIIKEAVKQELKVVIADRGQAAAIIAGLASAGVITDAQKKLVMVTDSPLQSIWARDTGPIIRFNSANGAADVSGTSALSGPDSGWNDEKSNLAIDKVGPALGIPTTPIPSFTHDDVKMPIQSDGGNWLPTTLNKMKVLIGTVAELFYGEPQLRQSVVPVLKTQYGIDRVITLTPIDVEATGYVKLANNHLDLQIRTLPGGNVIVADVASNDPYKPALDAIATTLTKEGFTVTRVVNSNAVTDGDKRIFASYTNALFLNKTVLIPSFNDAARDAEAVAAYEKILNQPDGTTGKPPGYKIVPVDSRQAVKSCGAMRCTAREIPQLPSIPAGKEASSKNNPHVSFDSATGLLNFTPGVINFLGDAAATTADPIFAGDLFAGAIVEVSGLTFERGMSEGDQFAFTGGELLVHRDGNELMTADIPVFTVNGTWPTAALDMAGVLANLEGPASGASAWFDAFRTEVLESSSLLADFFASSPVDLIALSQGFSESFENVELVSMGIVGNGASIPEPTSVVWLTAVTYLAVFARRRQRLA